MKLKTLKDFEGCDENGIEIDYSELKEEAIKEVQELRDGNYELFPKGIDDYIGLILYLKWKFNITEDDLKWMR